jgi:glutamate--cysteine ligase
MVANSLTPIDIVARTEMLQNNLLQELTRLNRGVEKEGLRVDPTGFIAQTPHPATLGHTLTNPQITTDYSESLLELITPVYQSTAAVIHQLENVHNFVQHRLGDELLWAGSMPCRLEGDDSIPIADYGSSHLGQMKHVYRKGLAVRYGRVMQSIAGLHYNFSLPESFWPKWQQLLGDDTRSLRDFQSAQYFSLIRNFRRHSWLIMYLFGASPALDASFVDQRRHPLQKTGQRTWSMPYATSLRMGDLGYHNNAQAGLGICFNKLANFINTLDEAIHTPYPPYQEIGMQRDGEFIQLNTNILQIENEYYSSIRPKRTIARGEKSIHALQERGVEYIEVRCMDLNPFQPVGVAQQDLDFLDLFLLYCLTNDSPWIEDAECAEIERNFSLVVNEGRDPALMLSHQGKKVSLQASARQVLEAIQPFVALMNKAAGADFYSKPWQEQWKKVESPELTPSAQVAHVMAFEKLEHIDFILELSRKHQEMFKRQPLSKIHEQLFTKMAEQSFKEEQALSSSDSGTFADYLSQYLS